MQVMSVGCVLYPGMLFPRPRISLKGLICGFLHTSTKPLTVAGITNQHVEARLEDDWSRRSHKEEVRDGEYGDDT